MTFSEFQLAIGSRLPVRLREGGYAVQVSISVCADRTQVVLFSAYGSERDGKNFWNVQHRTEAEVLRELEMKFGRVTAGLGQIPKGTEAAPTGQQGGG